MRIDEYRSWKKHISRESFSRDTYVTSAALLQMVATIAGNKDTKPEDFYPFLARDKQVASDVDAINAKGMTAISGEFIAYLDRKKNDSKSRLIKDKGKS